MKIPSLAGLTWVCAVLVAACSDPVSNDPVTLSLRQVDGAPIPAPVGLTSQQVLMLAVSGQMQGFTNGTDCSYTIVFQPSTGGPTVEITSKLGPLATDTTPCKLSKAYGKEFSLTIVESGFPRGAHSYRFE
jgi:hypothetical protein